MSAPNIPGALDNIDGPLLTGQMEANPPTTMLRQLIAEAINYVSAENGSNTPDFMLADYLVACLEAFDKAVSARERWYGRGAAANPEGAAQPAPGSI